MTRWIPLLVPEEHYPDLAAEITRLVRENEYEAPYEYNFESRHDPLPPKSEAPGVAEEKLSGLKTWSVKDLRRLAAGDTRTTERWTMALDYCAQHVGQLYSTEEVATATGMSVAEWRDACRKIRRHLTRHYPAAPGWPLQDVGGRKIGKDDQVYWGINEPQADAWRAARAS